jgi:hypothetical protein
MGDPSRGSIGERTVACMDVPFTAPAGGALVPIGR